MSIVSEDRIITDWKLVNTNRDFRSQITKFVGKYAHHYQIKSKKMLVINSEAMKNDDGVFPYQYQQGKYREFFHLTMA